MMNFNEIDTDLNLPKNRVKDSHVEFHPFFSAKPEKRKQENIPGMQKGIQIANLDVSESSNNFKRIKQKVSDF